MTREAPSYWLPLLDRALECEIGIGFKIEGVDRKYFNDTLCKARRASPNPRHHELVFFMPAGDHEAEIWICRKQVELDDDQHTGLPG